MGLNTLHDRILEVIKERSQPNNITNHLTEILCLGKEAVYRRLRGEVSFSLEEVAIIAIEFGISVDDIIGNSNYINNRSFQLKTTSYIEPLPIDFHQMNAWMETLSMATQSADFETGELANNLNPTLFYPYINLTHFFHFKWQYQWKEEADRKPFKEISFSKEYRDIQMTHAMYSRKIAKTLFIWDPFIFQYVINDITYFRNIDLLSEKDIENLKIDLLLFTDELEFIAKKGCYDTGNSVELYISNMNIDATYTYYKSELLNLSIIKAFTLNCMVSSNSKTTNELRNWILAQKRQATLISESGEMQRINFFKKQRELINTL